MKKTINIFLAIIVSIGLIVCLSSCGEESTSSNEVNLNDYVHFESSGYNGYGSVSYTFDSDTFVEDNSEKVALKSETNSESSSVSATKSLANFVANCGELSQTEDLNNDDVVTFSWTFDKSELNDIYSVKLEYSDIEYTVEGLQTLQEVDIINGGELNGESYGGIEVDCEGISPHGSATINTDNCLEGINSSMFTLSSDSGLANGTTITVTITDESKQELAEKYGIIPTVTEKEYMVEGLAYYPYDLSEIPEEAIKNAWSQAEEGYSDTLSTQWLLGDDKYRGEYTRKLVSMDYIGNYYFVNEDSGDNDLIVVFEINALQIIGSDEGRYTNSISDPVHYYWFAYYPNIIINSNGECTITKEYREMSDMFGKNAPSFIHTTSYKGYSDFEEFDKTYSGYQSITEMLDDIQKALSPYTLVNNNVNVPEEENTETVEENN